jgi:hypothetical protein
MQLPRSIASFQIFIAVATVLEIGCCLVSTANMDTVEAAQPAVFQEEAPPNPRSASMPVLVEFIPSEECSKCSAVDAELARLDREQPISGAHIIVLRESANSLAGADPNFHYSSELFSRRQQGYQELFGLDSISTPQIVVNGAVQSKGTSKRQIEGAIAEAVKEADVVPVHFATVQVRAGSVGFILRDCPSTRRYVNVIAALIDPIDATEVRTVDNGVRVPGQAGVLRFFGVVGSSFRAPRDVGGTHFHVPIYLHGVDSSMARAPAALEGKRLVVFVQVKHVGPVIGVASCTLHLPGSQLAANEETSPADSCPISD